MSEVLELSAEERKITAAEKRARIEEEFRKNSARSDREIGRLCGVDGKTVAAARERWIGAAAYSASTHCEPPPDMSGDGPEADEDYFREEYIAVPHQPLIAVYDNPHGSIVIREQCLEYDREEAFITVRPENVELLILKLREVARTLLDRRS